MIDSNGWFDWSIAHAGPPDKVWPDKNALECVFFHSAVGTLRGTINIVMGPASNQRSVTGVIGYDGTLVQFYSVEKSPWANGSHEWNRRGIGIEFEGGGYWANGQPNYSEPLTNKQIDSGIQLLKDLAAYKQVPEAYWQRTGTLKEHNEVYATECPSGRVQWERVLAGLVPHPSSWILGGAYAGLQKVGNQLLVWNNGIMGNAIGDYAGNYPGALYHLAGDKWIELTNEDPNVPQI